MQNLLDFFVQYKHWLVFILLEAISLTGLFSFNGYQKSVYLTTANGVVGSFYDFISSVTSYLSLGVENERLEAENERLRAEVVAMQQSLAESRLDSLHARGLPERYNTVGAQVVRQTLHRSNNLITINRGTADGIRPEMGVLCSHGVVGVVYLTSKHYSIVMPLLNEDSKVSCRMRHTDYFGTLEWKRGRADIAYAVGVPLHAGAKKGDVIETNGYSDIFPPGIPIGRVQAVENSADGMSHRLRVSLFTDFKTLREVSVVTDYTKEERKELEAQADSLNASSMQEP